MGAGLGFNLNAGELNRVVGEAAANVNQALLKINELRVFFDTWTNEQITTEFGLTAEQASKLPALRSAVVDLDKLRAIYQGADTQTTLFDFRGWARQVWGVGARL